VLSHIVVKGSRSSEFVVFTGSVRAQHEEQLISSLKYKLTGSFSTEEVPYEVHISGSRVFGTVELHKV
jgi:hypothetical protein